MSATPAAELTADQSISHSSWLFPMDAKKETHVEVTVELLAME